MRIERYDLIVATAKRAPQRSSHPPGPARM